MRLSALGGPVGPGGMEVKGSGSARPSQRERAGSRSRTESSSVRPADTGAKAWASMVRAACSSGLRSISAGGDVELELLHAGRARDHHHLGQGQQPGQRDLGGLGVVRRGDLAQRVQQRSRSAQVLGAEQAVGRPDPAGAVLLVVAAAEQALGQGAVGHHHPVLALRERDEVEQRARVGQREVDLVAHHRPAEGRFGQLPAGERVVADPDRTDPAGPQQGLHPRHDHRVADERVGLVDLVERDGLELQPAGATVGPPPGHRGEGRDREELAGHHDLGPTGPERLAQDPLAPAGAVDLGGVEEGDPELEGAGHDLAGGAPGVRVAVAPLAGPELPGAETDTADATEAGDVQELHPCSMPAPPRCTPRLRRGARGARTLASGERLGA